MPYMDPQGFLLFDWFGVNVLKTREKENNGIIPSTIPSFVTIINDVFFQAGLPSILLRKKDTKSQKFESPLVGSLYNGYPLHSIWVFPKIGVPQIIHFSRVFHGFPL